MLRVLRSTANVVLRLVAILSLAVFLVIAVGPRTGKFQVLTVLTGSMTPTAPQGSMAFVAPKSRSDLHVGDVLTYAIPVEDHHVVTHRVIEVRRTNHTTVVRTKGDANKAADPWIAELHDRTVWTERFAVPYLGRAIAALRSPLAHRLGQLAPILLAVAFLRNLWRKEEAAPDAVAA